MIRFRNPGTQYSTQIQVIKQLYQSLKDQAFFTLDDMAVVIAQGKLMTAYGYAGDDALRLSRTDQESMNSALMNAKMYERAEVARLIADFKETYGYKIGVIDLKSLLSLAISILVDGKGFDKEQLYTLEGLANASI